MATYKYYKYDMPTTTYTPTAYSDNSGAYASDIAKAQTALNQTLASKPSAYKSQYADRINTVIDKLNNRSFSYDVNSDALFQQLKSIYDAQGRSAMNDAMGQAAALTGGYGNSYAAAVGNQARQAANEQLYNRIPELYQLALSRYNQEGNDLNNQYSILSNEDTTAYGRYRDTVSDYENERAYRETALNNLRGMNQNLWAQNESNNYNANQQAWNNYWTAEQQTAANRAKAVAEDQWAANYEENKRQYDESLSYNKSKDSNEYKAAQLESDARVNSFMRTLPSYAMWKSSPYGTGESWESFVDRQIALYNKKAGKDEKLSENEVLQIMAQAEKQARKS